jgi:hypothetical protein
LLHHHQGLKANLKNAYFKLDNDKLAITSKPAEYKKLLFGLCCFHAIVQERRKFGPLGWNIPYEFNDTDLDISRGQLAIFLDSYEEVPYRVLNFLTSYINYGGRVTDYIDLRTIDVIMKSFYNERILEDGYRFDSEGIYFSVAFDEANPHASYMEYIDSLPLVAGPGVFGLHENANIAYALNEAFTIFDTILSLQVRTDMQRVTTALSGLGARDFYDARLFFATGTRVVQGRCVAGGADRGGGARHREAAEREGGLRHRADPHAVPGAVRGEHEHGAAAGVHPLQQAHPGDAALPARAAEGPQGTRGHVGGAGSHG